MSLPATFAVVATSLDRHQHTMGVGVQSMVRRVPMLLGPLVGGWLAVAFAVRGLKEFGRPARKALIIAQAQPGLRARTYGAYYLIRDGIVTTGSFLGAWRWSIRPQANFIGAAVCGALGTAWFWRFVYVKP